MPLQLHAEDETSTLDTVILGIAEDPAGPGSLNPKTRFHIDHGTYPTQDAIREEMNSLEKALIENGVKIFRPQNSKNLVQLFTRDLGFVVGDTFFVSQMEPKRMPELAGIDHLLDLFDPQKIVRISGSEDIRIEGGDVVLRGDTVFVGLSERTNRRGFLFLKEQLKGKKTVVPLKLVMRRNDHRSHSLHLDCAFQPLGDNHTIVYEDGIRDVKDLYKHLDVPDENIFKADEGQFHRMFANVLSLSKTTVVIEKEFIELKYWLLARGFNVVEVQFREIGKLNGLVRCATLPLIRK